MHRCNNCRSIGTHNQQCQECNDPECRYIVPLVRESVYLPIASRDEQVIQLPPLFACSNPECDETGPQNAFCESCDDTRFRYSVRIEQPPMVTPQPRANTESDQSQGLNPLAALRKAQDQLPKRLAKQAQAEATTSGYNRQRELEKGCSEHELQELASFVSRLHSFLVQQGRHQQFVLNFWGAERAWAGPVWRRRVIERSRHKSEAGWLISEYNSTANTDALGTSWNHQVLVLVESGALYLASGSGSIDDVRAYHDQPFQLGQMGQGLGGSGNPEDFPTTNRWPENSIPRRVAALLHELGLTWDGN